VSYYRQPWGRLTVTGQRCRLQVLDPRTAFELEPELVERFGDHLLMALGAPRHVFGAMWSGVAGEQGYGGSFAEAIQDPEHGLELAAAGLQRMSRLLITCMMEARLDGPWIVQTFERMVFDRLTVGDLLVEDWATWTRSGLGAEARWRMIAAQLEQTYQPLWTRSPYSARAKKQPDLGVPLPTNVPLAVQWADALATTGHVPSAHEALTTLTPDDLMNVVEMAAYGAEVERRAMEPKAQAR
jgi:hypothetical protein